jgi:autophagy-related protein 5
MAEVDAAMRKAIWEGRIACEISVNAAIFEGLPQFDAFELHSLKLTPLNLFVHRGSYLPLLLPQIKVHFCRWLGRLSRPLIAAEGEAAAGQPDLSMPWFSWEGQPLHWHHPIGISFDVCEQRARRMKGDESVVLPWRLQVNFHGPYPAFPHLLPFTDPDAAKPAPSGSASSAPPLTIQQMFYSSWKQADCLRWGTCRRTANLSKAAQCQVWDGLWTRNQDRFWEVNGALLQEGRPSSNGLAKQATPMAQRVPVRSYILDAAGAVAVKQWPVEMAAHHTVQHLLTRLGLPRATAILHGLELHPDTPLPWLALNCAYPDNFIHLLIAPL